MKRDRRHSQVAAAALLFSCISIPAAFAMNTKTVIAEAQYVMADGDTLSGAE